MTAGAYREVGEHRWPDVTAMAGLGDLLYLVSRRGLYQLDPATASYRPMGDEVWDVNWLAGAAGALFAIDESGTMFRIDPADGSYRELGEHATWARAQAIAGSAEALYVVDGTGLYAVVLDTGGYQQIGGEPWEPLAMVATPELHVINEDGTLYRIAVPDGEWEVIGDDRDWAGAAAVATAGGRIYVVVNEHLYQVDPASGEHGAVSEENWDVTHLAAARGRLYARTPDDRLYEIDLA